MASKFLVNDKGCSECQKLLLSTLSEYFISLYITGKWNSTLVINVKKPLVMIKKINHTKPPQLTSVTSIKAFVRIWQHTQIFSNKNVHTVFKKEITS